MQKIQNNINLKNYTSMALECFASNFVEVESIDEIRQALSFAEENLLDIIILGEGSNSLFIDNQQALVIKINLRAIKFLEENANNAIVYAGAGENWDEFVAFCIEHKLYGLENLSLIPGTVGAAPVQNIGAYGVELNEVLEWVDILNIKTLKTQRLTKDECEFSYRDSIFKRQLKDQVIITGAAFKLSKIELFVLKYAALDEYLIEHCNKTLSLEIVRDAVINIRRSKLPDPKELPNAGSFFKNPIVDLEHAQRLKNEYPNLLSYPYDQDHCKLAAGWLIDQAGWKSKRYQHVAVHDKQALVLVNFDQASGAELMQLASDIQDDIKYKYAVKLEIEPRIYY